MTADGQLALGDSPDPLPPHVDSDTSRQAAESMRTVAPRLRETVYRVIAADPRGLTCDAVEVLLPTSTHQSVSARIRELSQAGRIYDTGERRLTRSNRKARVYRCG